MKLGGQGAGGRHVQTRGREENEAGFMWKRRLFDALTSAVPCICIFFGFPVQEWGTFLAMPGISGAIPNNI